MMHDAGYPFVAVQRMGIDTNSHQCGTIRFGTDPALTIAAQALRVADHMRN